MTAAEVQVKAGGAPATPLDKRRSKWLATVQASAGAAGALADLDKELAANVAARRASRVALEAARTRAEDLEKEIKALDKQRERLRTDRTNARRDVRKARRRTEVAERKFDKALLADLLRQARTADLATHGGSAASRARGGSAAKATATPRRRPAATNGRGPKV